MCDTCGYISRHWNGKVNLLVADFDGEDTCPKCGSVMRAKPYDMERRRIERKNRRNQNETVSNYR